MAVRFIEFFEVGSNPATRYLNDFIKAHPDIEVLNTQFAFDSEDLITILARVSGSEEALKRLEDETEKLDADGYVM